MVISYTDALLGVLILTIIWSTCKIMTGFERLAAAAAANSDAVDVAVAAGLAAASSQPGAATLEAMDAQADAAAVTIEGNTAKLVAQFPLPAVPTA